MWHAATPSDEVLPAGQLWHALDEVAPLVAEYFPVGQLWHVLIEVAPVEAEYFPGRQARHCVPSAQVYSGSGAYVPAGHIWQEASEALPEAECFPAGQARQGSMFF